MWMIILQYRKRILIGAAALALAGSGFLAGRETAREPELASGFYRMDGQLEAALPAESNAAASAAESKPAEAKAAKEPAAKSAAAESAASPAGSAQPQQTDAATAAAASATAEQAAPAATRAPSAAPTPAASAVPTGAGRPSGAEARASAESGQAGGLIDLNAASLEELMKLPRIGEAKAQAIIAYREQHGGFRTAYEITEVKGIGQKTYESFKDRITVTQ